MITGKASNQDIYDTVHMMPGSNGAINYSEAEAVCFLNRQDKNPLQNPGFCF